MQIVFATNNPHKLSEIRSMLNDDIELLSLDDIGCYEEIQETGSTLEENAKIKAQYIYDKYQLSVFADDTGLEVEALGGAPGVRSARYANPQGHDSSANISRLLHEMKGMENRKARFRTVIALILKDKESGKTTEKLFEGIVNGQITLTLCGTSGFGYDPVFLPDGHKKTFAEMSFDVKNKISHRAKAIEKLINFIKNTL